MRFYKVQRGAEVEGVRVALCGNPQCEGHRKAQAGRTAHRKCGGFFRVEAWRWECPLCAEVETHYMVLVG